MRSSHGHLVTRAKQANTFKTGKIEFFDAETNILIKQETHLDSDAQTEKSVSNKAQRKLL